MKKFINLVFVVFLIFKVTPLMANCAKCERIREKNNHLPPLEHEFYDDYLKALEEDDHTASDEIDFIDDDKNDSSA